MYLNWIKKVSKLKVDGGDDVRVAAIEDAWAVELKSENEEVGGGDGQHVQHGQQEQEEHHKPARPFKSTCLWWSRANQNLALYLMGIKQNWIYLPYI